MNVGDRVVTLGNYGEITRRGVITHNSHDVEAQVRWDGGGASIELFECLHPEPRTAPETFDLPGPQPRGSDA